MPDPRFFKIASPIEMTAALQISGARWQEGKGSTDGQIAVCAPLASAGRAGAAFFSDKRYVADLRQSKAAYIFVNEANHAALPDTATALITSSPQAAWSRLAAKLYGPLRHDGEAAIHPTARIEAGASIGVGVVIGQGAEIGRGTRLEAYSVIGPGVSLGRDCFIGSHTSLHCAMLGDRVTIASGARIGESGFGVSGDAKGLIDVPQLGRVVIQDDVSIGAATCVDRGAYDDTLIGEGSKVDNMVQIAHNVRIGRHCIIAAHSGISGSVVVGDGAMFGGRAGIIDHIEIGAGAKIAAGAIVLRDVPPGEVWSGHPAKLVRQFLRETAWLSKQVATKEKG